MHIIQWDMTCLELRIETDSPPSALPAYPWVMSLYPNKEPVISTHQPIILRPLDCDRVE